MPWEAVPREGTHGEGRLGSGILGEGTLGKGRLGAARAGQQMRHKAMGIAVVLLNCKLAHSACWPQEQTKAPGVAI